MRHPPKLAATTLLCCCLALLAACGNGSNNNDGAVDEDHLPIGLASIETPPDEGAISLLSTTFDLAEVGYRQQEYFLAGSANALRNTNELGSDGRWALEPAATAPYRTRIVVYRPIAEADFSGSVFVEWLNVTAGFETPPSWGSGHTELLRSGHAWVGVSAQYVGIEGSPNALLPLHLKAVNPARYGGLEHPGDSFSYDIFSQVARVLRESGAAGPLQGLIPRQLIAVGESQSASRLLSYVNGVHPLYHAYDGYMLHSRGNGSSSIAQAPEVAVATPEVVRVRTDLDVPVFSFQTETDVLWLESVLARQEDSRLFRLWEVPGTAHGDYYSFVSGRTDSGTGAQYPVVVEEDSILGFIQCDAPMNAGPMAWIFNAALSSLHYWVSNGVAPARADRIALTDDGVAFGKDDLGNVLGGIRNPYVDAPAAILSGQPNTGNSFCFLFGTTQLLDAAAMASRYVDRAGYLQAVADATDKTVARGFLLAADGERIKAAAALQWDMLTD